MRREQNFKLCTQRTRPMSALGQKQTFAVHQPMSALPPKATLNAFLRMSAKASSGLMQCSKLGSLLDHLVGEAE